MNLRTWSVRNGRQVQLYDSYTSNCMNDSYTSTVGQYGTYPPLGYTHNRSRWQLRPTNCIEER